MTTSGRVKSTATCDAGVGQGRERVALVHRRGEHQPVGRLDGPADLRAHATARSDDPDPDVRHERQSLR